MANQKTSAADALFEIIEEQQGYFTAKQAAEAGFKLGSQAHHAKAGNWIRVDYPAQRQVQGGARKAISYQ